MLHYVNITGYFTKRLMQSWALHVLYIYYTCSCMTKYDAIIMIPGDCFGLGSAPRKYPWYCTIFELPIMTSFVTSIIHGRTFCPSHQPSRPYNHVPCSFGSEPCRTSLAHPRGDPTKQKVVMKIMSPERNYLELPCLPALLKVIEWFRLLTLKTCDVTQNSPHPFSSLPWPVITEKMVT